MTGVIVKFLGISFERLPVSPILGFSISLKLNIMFLSECPSDITDGCSTHSSVDKKAWIQFHFFCLGFFPWGQGSHTNIMEVKKVCDVRKYCLEIKIKAHPGIFQKFYQSN